MTTYDQAIQDCLDAINYRLINGPTTGFDGATIRTGIIIAHSLIRNIQKGGNKDGTNKENLNQLEKGSTSGKR